MRPRRGSNSRCALLPSSTPKYTYGALRSSIFSRCGTVFFACAVHPNTRKCARKCAKCGFLTIHASYGVRFPIALVGGQLRIEGTLCDALPPPKASLSRSSPSTVSAPSPSLTCCGARHLFCYGEYSTVKCRWIPADSHCCANSPDRNSPP